MKKHYIVSTGNRHTGFSNVINEYESLEEFIESFPLADRQCIEQVNRHLKRDGYFIFADFDCLNDFMLTVTCPLPCQQ